METDESPSRTFSAGSIWVLLVVALGSSALTALLILRLTRADVGARDVAPPAEVPQIALQPAQEMRLVLGCPVSLSCEPDIDRKGAFGLGVTPLREPHAAPEDPPSGTVTVTVERPGQDRASVLVEWKLGVQTATCTLDLDPSSQTASALYQGSDGQRAWMFRDVRGLVQVSSWDLRGPFLLDVTLSGHAQFLNRRDPLLSWRQFKLAIDA